MWDPISGPILFYSTSSILFFKGGEVIDGEGENGGINMLSMIQNGIVAKLEQEFGTKINVYVDEGVEQGLTKPCFLIAIGNPSVSQKIGSRFLGHHPFRIKYLGMSSQNNLEIQMLAQDLYEALDIITVSNGDKLRGTKMRHELVNGELQFDVNYDMYVRKVEEPKELMGTLAVNNLIKGGKV